MQTKYRLRKFCYFVLFIWSAGIGLANGASFTPLGSLPEASLVPFFSIATDVSADGGVVAGISTAGETFRWTAGGGMVGLGAHHAGFQNAYVSADGNSVVGTDSTTSGFQAFRWRATSGVVHLGDLAGGGVFSAAGRASADGSVVVGQSVSGFGHEAFRWTETGGMVGLGALSGGTSSGASDVSADGSVVVGFSFSDTGGEAFRWTQAGGMVGLGDLLGGGSGSSASAVSTDGSVVVGQSISASGAEAFRWTQTGGMVGLGAVPGVGLFSIARDVSADGVTVVGSTGPLSNTQAVIWNTDTGAQRVRDVLTTNGVDATSWVLRSAEGVSADGTVVVGWGVNPSGMTEAWMADLAPIPLPPAIWLFGSALAGLVGFARRNSSSFGSKLRI